jgi:hypothetical protein
MGMVYCSQPSVVRDAGVREDRSSCSKISKQQQKQKQQQQQWQQVTCHGYLAVKVSHGDGLQQPAVSCAGRRGAGGQVELQQNFKAAAEAEAAAAAMAAGDVSWLLGSQSQPWGWFTAASRQLCGTQECGRTGRAAAQNTKQQQEQQQRQRQKAT